MSKWIPDRKIWAGGVTMIVAWLIVQLLNVYAGADIPIGADAILAFGLGKAVEYFVPQPAKELISKIDDTIVAAAGKSPTSAVSEAVGEAAKKAVVKEIPAPASVGFDELMKRLTAPGQGAR